MKYARYGEEGDCVDLAEFIRRQDGLSDVRKWTVRPFCPDCGAAMHPYDVKGALGFQTVAKEITRAKPGFHHFDHAAEADCPSSFANDPRFQGLSRSYRFDGRIRERNKRVLSHPDVRAENEAMLGRLLRALRGATVEFQEVQSELNKAEKKWATLELLGSHPWVLPYLTVLFAGHVQRTSNKGKPFKAAFDAVGEQVLPYTDVKGERRLITVPQKVQLCFVNKSRRGGVRYEPMTYGQTLFDVARSKPQRPVLAKTPYQPAHDPNVQRPLTQTHMFRKDGDNAPLRLRHG